MITSAKGFLHCVVRSGLIPEDQLEEALRTLPIELKNDAANLANHLVRAGLLTNFQAHKLLKGATLGLVLGPYQIQCPIARGGMGTVYLGIDSRNGLHVAIKVLPPKKAREKSRHLARFLREMEISTKVIHPHVALTYEIGIHQGVHYIAMEYVPGVSLYRLVQREGPLEVARAARLMAEVALALEHAHGMKLVHRDLKPSNIMITPRDHAKVLDLGLALMEGDEKEPMDVIGGPGYLVGSFDYMAPEQTQNSLAVDGRADLYSLGCTLYYVLAGKAPFPEGGKKEKIQAHRKQEPRPLGKINRDVPEKFARLVERMMAKDPEERFQNATQVRQELLIWAEGSPIQPLDQVGDEAFQAAVHAIENRSTVSADTSVDILFGDNPSSEVVAGKSGWLGIYWIIGGVVGLTLAVSAFILVAQILR